MNSWRKGITAASFFVQGDPVPEPRPKIITRARGGVPLPFPRAIKNKRVVAWRNILAAGCTVHLIEAFTGPLYVSLDFRFQRPKSQRKRNPPVWNTVGRGSKYGGDIDNLAKPVLDELENAGWFADDGAVVFLTCFKKYTDDLPGVLINIAPVEE